MTQEKFYKMNNVILTHYLISAGNPQGEPWIADIDRLNPLLNSVHGGRVILFHDCFSGDEVSTEMIDVGPLLTLSPNWRKFTLSLEWLYVNQCDFVWIVDSTDVEMCSEPWDFMQSGILYCGDENELLGIPWMFRHPAKFLQTFYRNNSDFQLLNPGVLGGCRDTVIAFLEHLLVIFRGCGIEAGNTNMGVFNYAARNYHGIIQHGKPVNTVFRKNQRSLEYWWKHK